MTKKLALVLAILLLSIVAWAIFFEHSNVSVIVNGQPVVAPWVGVAGITGWIVGAVALFCLAIVLAFVFAGVGLLILGFFVLAGLVVAWLMFPLLLLLLVPLALVWIFIAIIRKA
jgi:hypothetical protein